MRQNLRRNFWSGDLIMLKRQGIKNFDRVYKSTENLSPAGKILEVQTKKSNGFWLFSKRENFQIKPVFKSQYILSKVKQTKNFKLIFSKKLYKLICIN